VLVLLAGSQLCPAGLLGGGDALASGRGNGALLAGCGWLRFAAAGVDLAEGGQGGGDAVQFIGEAHAFLLKLAYYGLH
jgi:hypothetical protein